MTGHDQGPWSVGGAEYRHIFVSLCPLADTVSSRRAWASMGQPKEPAQRLNVRQPPFPPLRSAPSLRVDPPSTHPHLALAYLVLTRAQDECWVNTAAESVSGR